MLLSVFFFIPFAVFLAGSSVFFFTPRLKDPPPKPTDEQDLTSGPVTAPPVCKNFTWFFSSH